MSQGWSCPNCGKAHAPSVQTCPEVATQPVAPTFAPWPIYGPYTAVTIGYTGPKNDDWMGVYQ